MSIKTSSMDSSQTTTKDIGINTRRIARTIPPEQVKKRQYSFKYCIHIGFHYGIVVCIYIYCR